MRGVALDASGDIEIVSGRARLASGTEYLRQRLLARHRFFRGEWFRDLRQGFPWRELILGQKNPDLEVFRAAYRQMLITTPGVLSVVRIDLAPNRLERSLGISFEVIGTDGPVTVNANDEAFIIRFPESTT